MDSPVRIAESDCICGRLKLFTIKLGLSALYSVPDSSTVHCCRIYLITVYCPLLRSSTDFVCGTTATTNLPNDPHWILAGVNCYDLPNILGGRSICPICCCRDDAIDHNLKGRQLSASTTSLRCDHAYCRRSTKRRQGYAPGLLSRKRLLRWRRVWPACNEPSPHLFKTRMRRIPPIFFWPCQL